MFIQKLARFITSHFKAVFFVAMLITGIFGYFAQYLSIDASAETLLVEYDKDLKLTREVHARYQSADILIVSFSPKAYLLDDATLKTIKDLKADLLKIDGVENVTTLLDVPLLESPPRSIKEAISDVRTLTSPDINKTMVQNELMTSPLYASNLVSEDFKTTAIVIQLKDDTKYMELLNNRNHFSELSQKRALTKQ